jgi:hypothetical protein
MPGQLHIEILDRALELQVQQHLVNDNNLPGSWLAWASDST